jgi:hypothetical protein
MPISKSVDFEPKVLPAGRMATAFRAAFAATGLDASAEAKPVSLTRRLPDGSDESTSVSFDGLDSICDLREEKLSLSASVGGPGPNWHYLAVFGGRPGYANINARTPVAGVGQAMIDTFLATAGLSPLIQDAAKHAEAPAEPAHEPATESVPEERSTSTRLGRDPRLHAFVSYRFGVPANEASAATVQRFLELLNVEVTTGKSYEPRPIHEKVGDRLVGLDLLVLVIGVDGESPWTRDEIATARALGAAVVPIVVQGAAFEPGLFGDLEYISVDPDHIGDGFLSLLEAVVYLRRRFA